MKIINKKTKSEDVEKFMEIFVEGKECGQKKKMLGKVVAMLPGMRV